MNFVLYGSGANIHAAAWKLMESRRTDKLYSTVRNAGVETLCDCVEENFKIPEHTIELNLGNEVPIKDKHAEIPCFMSNGELYPICAVVVDNDRADVAPWDIDVNEVFDKVKPQIDADLNGYGIFTINIDEDYKVISIHAGFGEFGAITTLPVLRGDMVKMLEQCQNGEKPEFKVVNNCSVVRKHSLTGQKVNGLSAIPGSTGVFINACEYKDAMITTSEIPLYIAARGDTKEKSAYALSMAEKYITFGD